MSDGGNGTKQFRLVLVGSGRVGKTSLVWRFIHDRFCCQYQPTIEDSYRQLIQLPGSFIHSFIYSLTHSIIHFFICSFVHSLATTTTLSDDSNDNNDDDYTSLGFDWME